MKTYFKHWDKFKLVDKSLLFDFTKQEFSNETAEHFVFFQQLLETYPKFKELLIEHHLESEFLNSDAKNILSILNNPSLLKQAGLQHIYSLFHLSALSFYWKLMHLMERSIF